MKKVMKSTNDVKANIAMAASFLEEQRFLLGKQKKDIERNRMGKELRAARLSENTNEIELKGKEREQLIREVEKLTQVRIDKDVKLIEAGHESNRYVHCIYKFNRMALEEYLADFALTYQKGLEEDMKENPVESLLQLLHDKKILKKNFKPYQTAVSKGHFEEKPSRIYICPKTRSLRVETNTFLTVAGMNRLREKELKRIVKAAI